MAWRQLSSEMEEGSFIHGSQHYSVRFKFRGIFRINEFFTDQACYNVRNVLSKCIHHHLLDLAAIPDTIGDYTNKELADRLADEIRTSDCQCQRLSTYQKLVPSSSRISDSKRVKCLIRFRDGSLVKNLVLYFAISPRS